MTRNVIDDSHKAMIYFFVRISLVILPALKVITNNKNDMDTRFLIIKTLRRKVLLECVAPYKGKIKDAFLINIVIFKIRFKTFFEKISLTGTP